MSVRMPTCRGCGETCAEAADTWTGATPELGASWHRRCLLTAEQVLAAIDPSRIFPTEANQ